jgi:hypothetical protein
VLRHHRIGWLDDLDEYWLTWERWFIELEEAHTSYPALNFLRSPQSERSWITAAGTALDAAALMASTVDRGEPGPQGVSIRAGYIALRRIADFFDIAYDPDSSPTDPISISRSEFDDAWEQLAASGVPLISDQDQAWRDFAGWRVNYDTVLLSLAEITMAPYAPWTADRSPVDHQRPKVRRFGMRRRTRAED